MRKQEIPKQPRASMYSLPSVSQLLSHRPPIDSGLLLRLETLERGLADGVEEPMGFCKTQEGFKALIYGGQELSNGSDVQ
jgi:hypothetical protein